MPYPPTRKIQSREQILRSAAELFTQRGFERVSIDDIMADAGLTRGAFYSHFPDKGSLYAEAIVYAARQRFAQQIECAGSADVLTHLLNTYLSMAHVAEEPQPCPLAFLVNDVAQRDPKVRSSYTRVYKGLVDRLPSLNNDPLEHNVYLAVTALMIGGVAIARALDDTTTAEALLSACREASLKLLRKASQSIESSG